MLLSPIIKYSSSLLSSTKSLVIGFGSVPKKNFVDIRNDDHMQYLLVHHLSVPLSVACAHQLTPVM